MKISAQDIQEIILQILRGEDHRFIIQNLIDDYFFQYCLQFFQKVVEAKLNSQSIDLDWYKHYFIDNEALSPDDVLTYAGLNQKSVQNAYGSGRRAIKLEAALEHYEQLKRLVEELSQSSEIEVELTIAMRGVSVVLTLSESLLVVNALAVKRAGIRGGAWSALGKNVELPLMITLAHLFQVPRSHYAYSTKSKQGREVDFVFYNVEGETIHCEVKLMGRGNPESADAVYSRHTDLFIAHTLSELNRTQLDQNGIAWVELRDNGYRKLAEILNYLGVPAQPLDEMSDIEVLLQAIAPNVAAELDMLL